MQTLVGTMPDISIRAHGKPLRTAHLMRVVQDELVAYAHTTVPLHIDTVLVQRPDTPYDISHIVWLHELEAQTGQACVPPVAGKTATQLLEGNGICISRSLASALQVEPGDEVVLCYGHDADTYTRRGTPAAGSVEGFNLKRVSVPVSAVYTTGIEDIDERFAYLSTHAAQAIFEREEAYVTVLYVYVKHKHDVAAVKERLARALPLFVQAWYDLNPAFLQALNLERHAMLLVVGLLFILVALLVYVLLSLHIYFHTRTFVALYVQGLTVYDLRKIVLSLSCLLAIGPAAAGALLAKAICFVLDTGRLIALPADIYGISFVPAPLSWVTLAGILATYSLIALVSGGYIAYHLNNARLHALLLQRER
jgi:ABC-type lipoprotein release transport system permease subunit